jgi:hypothetical protein
MDLNSTCQATNQEEMVVEDYLAMMMSPSYCNEVARQKTPLNDYINMPPGKGCIVVKVTAHIFSIINLNI